MAGDFFDILPHGDNRWLICVADAMDHGVPAAMSSAMLKTLLLQIKDHSDSPAEILNKMNQVFMDVNLFGNFATIILLTIDLTNGKLVYANAGHDPAWLIGPENGPIELTATGTLLGIIENDSSEERSIVLPKSSRLAISTDGITETFNAENVPYGRDCLLNEINQRSKLTASKTADEIRQHVAGFRGDEKQTDDVTLLLIDIANQTNAVGP